MVHATCISWLMVHAEAGWGAHSDFQLLLGYEIKFGNNGQYLQLIAHAGIVTQHHAARTGYAFVRLAICKPNQHYERKQANAHLRSVLCNIGLELQAPSTENKRQMLRTLKFVKSGTLKVTWSSFPLSMTNLAVEHKRIARKSSIEDKPRFVNLPSDGAPRPL